MPESTDIRRKRLLFRSNHRGMREIDVLVGGFARRHLDDLDDQQVIRFEALLEESDHDLFNWITGKKALPEGLDHDLIKLIIKFKNEPYQP